MNSNLIRFNKNIFTYNFFNIRNNFVTKKNPTSVSVSSLDKHEVVIGKDPEHESDLNPTKPTKKVKRKSKTILEKIQDSDFILSDFNTKNEKVKLLSKFPMGLVKKKLKTPPHFYLMCPETAKLISNHLLDNLLKNQIIVEINPGPGLLTRELLNNDKLRKLLLYETYDEFIPDLEEIHSLYPDRVKVKQGDFINIWKLLFRDKIDNGNRVNDFLNDIPKSNYNHDASFRLFGGVGSYIFFKHLIKSLVFQQSLLSHCRCDMYFVMPPMTYIHLTCNNEIGYLIYRATTVLFQIMFEHHFIAKIPRNHFLPWQTDNDLSKRKKLTKIKSIDSDSLYFVKIVPRKNLYDLCPIEDMPALWFFIKQNLISRKHRIIPNLEKWVPRCGPRLLINQKKKKPVTILNSNKYLEKDLPTYSTKCTTMSTADYYDSINIFTEFGDLTPSQILTLFTEFRSWPEYKTSSFLASLENSLLKLEQSEDNENLVEIEIPDQIEQNEDGRINVDTQKTVD